MKNNNNLYFRFSDNPSGASTSFAFPDEGSPGKGSQESSVGAVQGSVDSEGRERYKLAIEIEDDQDQEATILGDDRADGAKEDQQAVTGPPERRDSNPGPDDQDKEVILIPKMNDPNLTEDPKDTPVNPFIDLPYTDKDQDQVIELPTSSQPEVPEGHTLWTLSGKEDETDGNNDSFNLNREQDEQQWSNLRQAIALNSQNPPPPETDENEASIMIDDDDDEEVDDGYSTVHGSNPPPAPGSDINPQYSLVIRDVYHSNTSTLNGHGPQYYAHINRGGTSFGSITLPAPLQEPPKKGVRYSGNGF